MYSYRDRGITVNPHASGVERPWRTCKNSFETGPCTKCEPVKDGHHCSLARHKVLLRHAHRSSTPAAGRTDAKS